MARFELSVWYFYRQQFVVGGDCNGDRTAFYILVYTLFRCVDTGRANVRGNVNSFPAPNIRWDTMSLYHRLVRSIFNLTFEFVDRSLVYAFHKYKASELFTPTTKYWSSFIRNSTFNASMSNFHCWPCRWPFPSLPSFPRWLLLFELIFFF